VFLTHVQTAFLVRKTEKNCVHNKQSFALNKNSLKPYVASCNEHTLETLTTIASVYQFFGCFPELSSSFTVLPCWRTALLHCLSKTNKQKKKKITFSVSFAMEETIAWIVNLSLKEC